MMQLTGVAVPGRLGVLSARIMPGRLLHLVGPNGAGKSTLLSVMAGLENASGTLHFAGEPLSHWRSEQLAQRRAYLMQQQTPPFAMPVWHYLALHQPAQPSSTLLTAVTGTLGLADKLARPVNQLSGGEWQRVRLAAVILQIHPQHNPQGQLLLLDEPMNSLDVAQQAALDRLLAALGAAGVAIVMSSHDLNHSLRHADDVWLLRAGELLAAGEGDKVLTPENLHAAYGMAFRRLRVENHSMLIATP